MTRSGLAWIEQPAFNLEFGFEPKGSDSKMHFEPWASEWRWDVGVWYSGNAISAILSSSVVADFESAMLYVLQSVVHSRCNVTARRFMIRVKLLCEKKLT